jgi:hypothetical protein
MKVKNMPRVIALALNQFEARGFELPSLRQFRAAYARITQVNADAAAMFAANDAVRSTARCWLL